MVYDHILITEISNTSNEYSRSMQLTDFDYRRHWPIAKKNYKTSYGLANDIRLSDMRLNTLYLNII